MKTDKTNGDKTMKKIKANNFKISGFSNTYNTKEEVKRAIHNYIKPEGFDFMEVSYDEFTVGKQTMAVSEFLDSYVLFE